MNRYQQKSIDAIIADIRATGTGDRNNALYRYGARLMELAGVDAATWILHQEGRALGLQHHEIQATVKSAIKQTNGRHGSTTTSSAYHTPAPPEPEPEHTTPPPEAWQATVQRLMLAGTRAMWDERGEPARAYLHQRGLTEETITRHNLGWCPGVRLDFGLDRQVWVPRGILIPWQAGITHWRVSVRFLPEDTRDSKKQLQIPRPRPTAQHLYIARRGLPGHPAILVEGEIDAMTLVQALPEYIAVFATGGVTQCRTMRNIAILSRHAPLVLWFDDDAAGDAATIYWRGVFPKARHVTNDHDANGLLIERGTRTVCDVVGAALQNTRPRASRAGTCGTKDGGAVVGCTATVRSPHNKPGAESERKHL